MADLNPQEQMARVSLSIYYQKNGQVPEAEAEAAKAKVLSWGGKLLPNEPGRSMEGQGEPPLGKD
jgi:hypothetical protein